MREIGIMLLIPIQWNFVVLNEKMHSYFHQQKTFLVEYLPNKYEKTWYLLFTQQKTFVHWTQKKFTLKIELEISIEFNLLLIWNTIALELSTTSI